MDVGCRPVLEGLGKAVLQQGEEAGRLVSLGLQEGGAGGELRGAVWEDVEEAAGGELRQDLGSADRGQVRRDLEGAGGGQVCGSLGGEQLGLLGDDLGPLLWRGFLVLPGPVQAGGEAVDRPGGQPGDGVLDGDCHPVLEGLGEAALQQGGEVGRLVSLGLKEGGVGGELQGGGLKGAVWEGGEGAAGEGASASLPWG